MRRLKRKSAMFLHDLPYLMRVLLLLPLWLLMQAINGALLLTLTRAKCGKIRLTCSGGDATFIEVTRDALALIAKCDARRYSMLQKELRFIKNTPIAEYAHYDALFRQCWVNFERIGFDWKNRDAPDYEPHRLWYVAKYASTLVHEATHGRLLSMGFPYNERTRLRVERICTREERRFAARLPQTTYDFAHDLVPPFDASRWEYDWNTPRWQWAKDQFRRAMKQINERND